MRIGFDFSGVIIDTQHRKVVTARKVFGLTLDQNNAKRTTTGNCLDFETYRALQHIVFNTSELLLAPPIPGAIAELGRLHKRGFDITAVSNISPSGVNFAKQWLHQHELSYVNFVSVGVGFPKIAWLRHNFAAFVDDKAESLHAVAQIVPVCYLLHQPYNADTVLPKGVTRIANWTALSQELMALDEAYAPVG